MGEYFSRSGHSIGMEEYARKHADRGYTVIAKTQIDEMEISTVWLGLDHAYRPPPLIFETMVFGGPLDQEQVRYSTMVHAQAGHLEMVERVKKEGLGNGTGS